MGLHRRPERAGAEGAGKRALNGASRSKKGTTGTLATTNAVSLSRENVRVKCSAILSAELRVHHYQCLLPSRL